MKALAIVAAIAALLVVGCGSDETVTPGGTGGGKKQDLPLKVSVGDYELGAPITSGNVTIVPVMYSKTPDKTGDEITLSEAKAKGLVEIIEIPGEEQVNRLRVHNKSDRPLLLMGGELLLGGKQDRIVVRDVIIPPGATQEVEVDCVEHGRWQGTTKHFDYAKKMVPNSVREAAAYGSQQEVWDNVAGYNARVDPTLKEKGTTITLGMSSPEIDRQIQGAMPELMKTLEKNDKIVGLVFVLNGEIKSLDLFGNPRTFQTSKESLLHSFLAEGAVAQGTAKAAPLAGEYKAFLQDVLDSRQRAQVNRAGGFVLTEPTLRGNEVRAYAPASSGKAEDGLVHGSYSRK